MLTSDSSKSAVKRAPEVSSLARLPLDAQFEVDVANQSPPSSISSTKSVSTTSDSAISIGFSSSSSSPSIQDETSGEPTGGLLKPDTGASSVKENSCGEQQKIDSNRAANEPKCVKDPLLDPSGTDIISSTPTSTSQYAKAAKDQHSWLCNKDGVLPHSHCNHDTASQSSCCSSAMKQNCHDSGGNQAQSCYQEGQYSNSRRAMQTAPTEQTPTAPNAHIYYHHSATHLTQQQQQPPPPPPVAAWYPGAEAYVPVVDSVHHHHHQPPAAAYCNLIPSPYHHQPALTCQPAIYTAAAPPPPPPPPLAFSAQYPLNHHHHHHHHLQPTLYPAHYGRGHDQATTSGLLQSEHHLYAVATNGQYTYLPALHPQSPPIYYYQANNQSINELQHAASRQQDQTERASSSIILTSQQGEGGSSSSTTSCSLAANTCYCTSSNKPDYGGASADDDDGNSCCDSLKRPPSATMSSLILSDTKNDDSGATSGIRPVNDSRPVVGIIQVDIDEASRHDDDDDDDDGLRDESNQNNIGVGQYRNETISSAGSGYDVTTTYQDVESARQKSHLSPPPPPSPSSRGGSLERTSSVNPTTEHTSDTDEIHDHLEQEQNLRTKNQEEENRSPSPMVNKVPGGDNNGKSQLSSNQHQTTCQPLHLIHGGSQSDTREPPPPLPPPASSWSAEESYYRQPASLNLRQPYTNSSNLLNYMLPAQLLGQNLLQSFPLNSAYAPHHPQPGAPYPVPLLLIPSTHHQTRPNHSQQYSYGRAYQRPPQDRGAYQLPQYYQLQSPPSANIHHLQHLYQPSPGLDQVAALEACFLPPMIYQPQAAAENHAQALPMPNQTFFNYKYPLPVPYYHAPSSLQRSQQQLPNYYAAAPATDYMAAAAAANRPMTDANFAPHRLSAPSSFDGRYAHPYSSTKTGPRSVYPVPPMIAFSQTRLDYNLISKLPIDACPTRTRQAYGMDKVWRDEFEQLFSQLASNIVWTLIEVESNPSIRDSSSIIGYKGRYIVKVADANDGDDDHDDDDDVNRDDDDVKSCSSSLGNKSNCEDDKESSERESCQPEAEDGKTGDVAAEPNQEPSDDQTPKNDLTGELDSDCDSGAQLADLASGSSSTCTGTNSESGELKELEIGKGADEKPIINEGLDETLEGDKSRVATARKFPTRFRMFIDSAKVRFCCDHCGHGWTSMKGRVVFWYELFELVDQTSGTESGSCGDWAGVGSTENELIGYCAYKLFGQQCDVCKIENRFERPMWYPEEVSKVLNNLYNKIGQIYFGFKMPAIDKQRRAGKPKTSHNSSLCQACHDGVCTDRK